MKTTVTYSHQVNPDLRTNNCYERREVEATVKHHPPCFSIDWDTWSASSDGVEGENADSPEMALQNLSLALMDRSRLSFVGQNQYFNCHA